MFSHLLWLLFSFRGRIGRLAYFFTTSLMMLVQAILLSSIGAGILAAFQQKGAAAALSMASASLLASLLSLVASYSCLAIAAKRMHDFNWSFWWYWAPLGLLIMAVVNLVMHLQPFGQPVVDPVTSTLMIVGGIGSSVLGLMLMFRAGTAGDNDYGAPGGRPTAPDDKPRRSWGGEDEPEPELAADFDVRRARRYDPLAEAAVAPRSSSRPLAEIAPVFASRLPDPSQPRVFGRRGSHA